jgi:hypothetical protein
MKVAEAKRRYANAKRRALYWSGKPSFCPSARSNEKRSSKIWENYELAMNDCDSWENTLKALTGKDYPHFDPRREFAARFSQLLRNPRPIGLKGENE